MEFHPHKLWGRPSERPNLVTGSRHVQHDRQIDLRSAGRYHLAPAQRPGWLVLGFRPERVALGPQQFRSRGSRKPGSARVVAQGFRPLASDFWLLNIDKFLSMLALQAPKATMRSNGMRDDRYVLAIDMGSSSVKATLVSQRGELAGTGLRNVDILLLPGGGAEQDPEQWWAAAIAAAKSALATAAIPPERIVAVACTTQWAVTVPVDEDGHAIWNALSWMDTRGGRYSRAAVDGWPKIEGYAASKLLKWVRLTGAAPNQSGVDGFGHILYFKHERPDLYARTYKFLEPMDYLNFRLTGQCAASYSTIFPYWLTDNRNPNRIDYHPGLLRAAGIERRKMPDLRPVDAVLGELKPEVAAELGLLPGTRVVMGSGDSHAATVGAGCVRDYDGYFSIGTTAWLSCHVPWKKTDVTHSLATMPAALPGRYIVSAEQGTDGSAHNLTAYGGLLPVATMLEKLGFQQLVEENLTIKRLTRAMPVYQFVLAMVLALYVGFSRLHHLRFLEREPMLTGILKVLRLPPQCTFWRFLAALHLSAAGQILRVQQILRQRVWEAAHVELKTITLDTDTTVHILFGHQMGGRKSYNSKNRGKKSFQPILTFLAETREDVRASCAMGIGPAANRSPATWRACSPHCPRAWRRSMRAPIPVFTATKRWRRMKSIRKRTSHAPAPSNTT